MSWLFFLLVGARAASLQEHIAPIVGTYLVGDEQERLEVAVRVFVEGDHLIVDRWVRGRVQRLFECPLGLLNQRTDRPDSPGNVYLITEHSSGVYGSPRAPLSLRLRFMDGTKRLHLFLLKHGREVYRLRFAGYSAQSDYVRTFDLISQGLDRRWHPLGLAGFVGGNYRPPTCAYNL